jgi:superfamily II DNA or RNA helicase
MPDIVVSANNYSMLHVKCERGVAAELSEYFSFFVPGYKFMPAYKNKVWDGKIRLFNQITGELNTGLIGYLMKFCIERGYTADVEETEYGIPGLPEKIDTNAFNEFFLSLNAPYDLREYQYNAIIEGLRRKQAVLLSPTGSGKSYIIYCLMRQILAQTDNKILVIVPTTSLVEQMYSDFKEYGQDVQNEVHRIYSGKDKTTNKRVIVSTWQSIYKFPKPWFEQFDAVFGDECHGFKSKSLSSIMNKATEAKWRLGFTGTLDGTQTHQLVLEGLFGPVYNVTMTKQLQDDGHLAPLDIKVISLRYSEESRNNLKGATYQTELDFLVAHEKRNKFIANLSLSLEGNSLVLFRYVDRHGKQLFDLINSKADGDRKIFFVHGDVDTSDREAIRKIVEKQKNAIIVASLGTFSTGINIRNLHNIVFASPSKSQIKVLQSIGRGLRVSEDGRVTKLYDIADDLSIGKKPNYTLLHSAKRIKMYEDQQFNYKIVKVDLE